MNFLDLKIEASYETGIDDIVEDFYIPTLSCARRYDRISGFFSSTSLALAARGMEGFIRNGGTMRLLTCPRLSKEDVEVMEQASNNPDEFLEKHLIDSLSIEDSFQDDHVAALGWLLANGRLEVRIAQVYEKGRMLSGEEISSSSIMHQKVGVMYDEAFNSISFSGSNNESLMGWLNNVEEFKVFCEWKEGQKEYYQKDRERFERMWKGEHPSVKVVSLPEAVKKNLMEKGKEFDCERISLLRYRTYRKEKGYSVKHTEPDNKKKQKLSLFSYQEEAVKEWKENNGVLLLEMATGSGKTRTALGCLKEVLAKNKRVLAVIACPGNTLSMQWKKDAAQIELGIENEIICDGTNRFWRKDLDVEIKKLKTGLYQNLVVFTTHQTCSDDDFVAVIEENESRVTTMFIGDEVHGMGATKTKRGLLPCYRYRVGLSATPSRWFDDFGTSIIQSYFGDKSFVFSIHDALNTINPLTGKTFLVNYYYHPLFIELTDEEMRKYKSLSDRIVKMMGKSKMEYQEVLQNLLFKRADIEKSAENKYEMLETVLDEIGEGIEDTIIFVSPDQIERVLATLNRRGIVAHSFTQKESTMPSDNYGGLSEREYIIERFKEKSYKVLVAIKCLDEGIDIPSAKRAIVMASSTNPREYIQRVGRVIRQAEGKRFADIYDMIIKPDLSRFVSDTVIAMEKRIFNKEMDRVEELSRNALNNVQVLKLIYSIKGGYKI